MLFHHHHHHLVFFCFIWTQTSEEKRKREQKKKREENKYLPRQTDRRTENQSTQQNKTENFLVKRKHIEHGERKKSFFFPKQNKKEKEKAHTGRLQSFVFLCASPKGLSGEIQKEKREENPTKTEENGVCIVVVVVSSPEDKAREKKTRERKKKTKQNQEHQTHIQNGMRNEEENIFFGFLNRYKKVDDTRKSGTHTHTRIHTKRLVVFFCIFFFSWVHFKRDRNYK